MLRTYVTAAALSILALPAVAQSWESPTLFAPGPQDDIGLYIIDAERGDPGILGIWRQSGRFNLGVRAGMGGRSGSRTALVGAEFSGDLLARGGAQPFAVSWVAGAGASFDGITWLRVPFGVSAGIGIPGPSFLLMPYIHPRIALDIRSFDTPDGEDTDTELNADVDIGLDLRLGSAWVVRVGATRGDLDVVGVGLAYRIPRRAEVR